jgi:hypothetical protein
MAPSFVPTAFRTCDMGSDLMRGLPVCQTLVMARERLVALIWVARPDLLAIPASRCHPGVANRQPCTVPVNGA